MSPILKRKRDEYEDDSDEEEPCFGRQILPVANLPDSYDGPIIDGSQYLFTVRRDARRLPHVVRVANPYETPDVPISPKDDTHHPDLPTEAWRLTFERRFRNFRKNSTQPTIHVQLPEKKCKQKLMPDKNERDLWWEFIAGKPELVWNPPKKAKQTKGKGKKGKGMRAFSEEYDDSREDYSSGNPPRDDGDVVLKYEEEEVEATVEARQGTGPSTSISDFLPTPRETPLHTEEGEISDESVEDFTPREPTPALLNRVDHRLAIHLLMYLTNWINHHLRHPEIVSNRITEVHARWMFALLSRVDDYVGADDMSLLRNLARACIGLLKERMWKKTFLAQAGLQPSDDADDLVQKGIMGTRSCWMVIAAVVDVWAQRDLWQDAETMLREVQAP